MARRARLAALLALRRRRGCGGAGAAARGPALRSPAPPRCCRSRCRCRWCATASRCAACRPPTSRSGRGGAGCRSPASRRSTSRRLRRAGRCRGAGRGAAATSSSSSTSPSPSRSRSPGRGRRRPGCSHQLQPDRPGGGRDLQRAARAAARARLHRRPPADRQRPRHPRPARPDRPRPVDPLRLVLQQMLGAGNAAPAAARSSPRSAGRRATDVGT